MQERSSSRSLRGKSLSAAEPPCLGQRLRPPAVFSAIYHPPPPTEMSAPPPTATATTTATPQAQAPAPAPATVLPNPATLVQAAKLSIAQDIPIRLDYYVETYNKTAFMGEDGESKEKMLVKSAEEFTSLIQKTYKVGEDYIVLTENSIYVVSGRLEKRRIQANSLRTD